MSDKNATSDMIELDGADIYPNWENIIQGPNSGQVNTSAPQKDEVDFSADMLLDEKGVDYWQELFNSMNFPGMDLMAVDFVPTYVHNFVSEEREFQQKMKQFLRLLSDENVKDLRVASVSESSIFAMGKGIVPPNWTIHLKYPLAYGGKIDFDNMVLIQCVPFHEDIHTFINKQILSKAGVAKVKELFIPVPQGRVYVPSTIGTISMGGGKAAASIQGKINGGR